jgi:hypothetical protein
MKVLAVDQGGGGRPRPATGLGATLHDAVGAAWEPVECVEELTQSIGSYRIVEGNDVATDASTVVTGWVAVIKLSAGVADRE